ncbi:hypothetical protein I7I48_05000 [Histoplasma ohiense]|nr:hypothetical protein I7I48_05000 [Histoplasma ohiense (nom. inval.)]
MEAPSEIPQPSQDPQGIAEECLTLDVDFSWKHLKTLISSKGSQQATHLYSVHYKATKPHLTFKSAADDTTTFATGNLHTFSIDADCEIRGRPITLKALKRFKTEYMHHSYAFASSSNDDDDGSAGPVRMTWTSSCGLKTWDFICLDEQKMPVAKFSANIWGLKKVGYITFMGSNTHGAHAAGGNVSDAVREEIVVTGLTLFYCMVLRTNSVLSLFGAIFSRPGHAARKETGKEKPMAVDSEQRRS